MRFLRRRLRRPAVIADSGANIGQMLVPLLGALPCARYLAFEPGRAAGAWLREGAARNPSWPVALFPVALSDREGEASLAVPPEGHGCQAWVAERGDQPVRLRRLADVLAELGVDRLDFWKLDVEGHEPAALRGAAPLLQEGRIDALYVELRRDLAAEILAFLGAMGYSAHGVNFSGHLSPYRDTGLELTDAMFVRDG